MLTTFKTSSLVERRRRRKNATNESVHQIDGVSAASVALFAAAWIGTMAEKGTRVGEETITAPAVLRRLVATMPTDAADAIVTRVAPMTVTLALDLDLDHRGMEGSGRIPIGVGVPVHADVVHLNPISISRNGTENKYPTFSYSSLRRYRETSSAGSSGRSMSVD